MDRDRQQTPAIQVECYAGYRAEETPRRFFIGHREIEVFAGHGGRTPFVRTAILNLLQLAPHRLVRNEWQAER